MARPIYFEWEGKEHEREPKSADWYWALGIVAVAATIAAILFSEYLLALLIVIAASAIALHGAKPAPVHHFAITDEGLVIGTDLHRFKNMHSFAILEYVDEVGPPFLSIKTLSWFTPHLLIPLENVDADALYAHLLSHVEEGEHPHTFADLVASWLGL